MDKFKHKNTECNYCHNTGHLEQICLSRKHAQSKQRSNANAVSDDTDALYHVFSVTGSAPLKTQLTVNGVPIFCSKLILEPEFHLSMLMITMTSFINVNFLNLMLNSVLTLEILSVLLASMMSQLSLLDKMYRIAQMQLCCCLQHGSEVPTYTPKYTTHRFTKTGWQLVAPESTCGARYGLAVGTL